MKKLHLYLLKLKPGATSRQYDTAHGFVVCAETTYDARNLAAKWAGDEGKEAWQNVSHSTCKLIASNPKTRVGVVLRDFNAG